MSATKLTELAAKVETDLKAAILSHEIALGELTILAEASQIIAVLSNLQAAHGFSTLVDICGADYPQNVKRFEVVYHLLSMNNNLRVRVKAALEDGASLPSVVSLWPVANWFEREVFDMYGVLFEGHPEGHPLRKDFPLTGYQEVRYDEEQKRVIYEPVKLLQEYRDFDFESPWEHVTPDAIPALEAKS
ncbi:MAG: NADH-quinone oxidoreductase subunit C [Hyphomonadaceae bacterium]|nr:MAG: NADH-quinone oxidoreductase subunit C [Hyphomonadaceae bacterium]